MGRICWPQQKAGEGIHATSYRPTSGDSDAVRRKIVAARRLVLPSKRAGGASLDRLQLLADQDRWRPKRAATVIKVFLPDCCCATVKRSVDGRLKLGENLRDLLARRKINERVATFERTPKDDALRRQARHSREAYSGSLNLSKSRHFGCTELLVPVVRAGIGKPEEVTPHTLRHTALNRMIAGGHSDPP